MVDGASAGSSAYKKRAVVILLSGDWFAIILKGEEVGLMPRVLVSSDHDTWLVDV